MNTLNAAVQRLTMSRERLHLALGRRAQAQTAGASGLDAWLGRGALREWLGRWWREHPLHATGRLLAEAGHAVVAPLARRHPFGLVSAALLTGVAVVALRPWRWTLRSGVLAGLLPSLVPRMLPYMLPQLLASASKAVGPATSWLALLDALLSTARPAAGSGGPPRTPAA